MKAEHSHKYMDFMENVSYLSFLHYHIIIYEKIHSETIIWTSVIFISFNYQQKMKIDGAQIAYIKRKEGRMWRWISLI